MPMESALLSSPTKPPKDGKPCCPAWSVQDGLLLRRGRLQLKWGRGYAHANRQLFLQASTSSFAPVQRTPMSAIGARSCGNCRDAFRNGWTDSPLREFVVRI